MVTITITHEDGTSYAYEDVVAFDFYDKEFCESQAGRELSDKELADIEARMNHCEDVTSEAVTQTVKDVVEGR